MQRKKEESKTRGRRGGTEKRKEAEVKGRGRRRGVVKKDVGMQAWG